MWFNPIMSWLLQSPFHRLVSKNMMLVTFTGRVSGKSMSTPTNYLKDGNTLWVVSWRDRKWWRNLRGGQKICVLLEGREIPATGNVTENEGDVARSLSVYYQNAPASAKYVNINLDETGKPVFEDCLQAAKKMVMVRVALTG